MSALEGSEGVDVSLRELARTVGVSPAAVYRHFPNKDALLAELANEGLRILGTTQRAAYDAAGGGPSGFAETGRAYVRFALAHPALFRLIFAHGEPGRWKEREVDPLWMLRQSLGERRNEIMPGCGWLPDDWLAGDALRKAMRGAARNRMGVSSIEQKVAASSRPLNSSGINRLCCICAISAKQNSPPWARA